MILFSIILFYLFVIQSVAKDLEVIHVYVHEILPPFGRLNDRNESINVHDYEPEGHCWPKPISHDKRP